MSWKVTHLNGRISREGQEELFHLLAVHGVGSAAVGEALLEAGGDDCIAGAVQRPADRGDLGDDVLAVATGFDHPQHAADLTLGAAQSLDDRVHVLGSQFYHESSSCLVRGRIPLGVPGSACINVRLFGELGVDLAHVQLADNPGRHEPGSGEINFPFLLQHLDRIGYAGWVGCEYKPSGRSEDSFAWLEPWR